MTGIVLMLSHALLPLRVFRLYRNTLDYCPLEQINDLQTYWKWFASSIVSSTKHYSIWKTNSTDAAFIYLFVLPYDVLAYVR